MYAIYHNTKPERLTWADRIYQCTHCKNWVLIPACVVGGAWHLSGWLAPDGTKHFGTYYSPCFNKLIDGD